MTPATDRDLIDAVREAQNGKRNRGARRSDEEIVDAVRGAQEARRALEVDKTATMHRPWPLGQEMIYVFYEARRNVFKIGRTRNLTERLSNHRGAAIGDLRVLALIACRSLDESRKLERKLLAQCKRWRVPGKKEWFQVTPASCRELDSILLRSTHPAWVLWANRRLRPGASKFRASNEGPRGGVSLL